MNIVLEMEDVTRVHGHDANEVTALAGVSLTVRQGELVAVMGPSGSGKSTLLNVAGGLDTATSGVVQVCGHELAWMGAAQRAEVRRQDVGYVFQELNLVPALTALENVMLPLELDGMGVRAAREHAEDALGSVGLEPMSSRFPDGLSGGQQQRVAIARALVGSRHLVLADEPTGSLDSVTGDAFMRLLRHRIDSGTAGLLVTHDARHAAWADRTIHLRDGQIVMSDGGFTGEPSDLMEAEA